MNTIRTLSRICFNLSIGLGLQQIIYGMKHDEWIDFSTWTTTTLAFESLFILSIVFSSIVAETLVAVRPMKSGKNRKIQDVEENIYTPKEN